MRGSTQQHVRLCDARPAFPFLPCIASGKVYTQLHPYRQPIATAPAHTPATPASRCIFSTIGSSPHCTYLEALRAPQWNIVGSLPRIRSASTMKSSSVTRGFSWCMHAVSLIDLGLIFRWCRSQDKDGWWLHEMLQQTSTSLVEGSDHLEDCSLAGTTPHPLRQHALIG